MKLESEKIDNLCVLYSYKSKESMTNLPCKKTAVEARNVSLSYGRGKKIKPILSSIDLTVPEASIYGLLGPSGCGKTTLLRCVIGRLPPTQGSIRIFGFRPGDPGSQIPGTGVGYMPQEIAVYEDFTIEETLTYFGRLFRLDKSTLTKRIDFLLAFLDLPPKSRLVVNLSGGQKRRVSLAAALVHNPPLLILDEPTVGVDPLLRHSIWHHLVTLTQTEKTTVIITTHYIEEARQAHVVGLMRRGRLLAEDSPEELLRQNNTLSLEQVFLTLCMSDTSNRSETNTLSDVKDTTLTTLSIPNILGELSPELKSKENHGISVEINNSGTKGRKVFKMPSIFPKPFSKSSYTLPTIEISQETDLVNDLNCDRKMPQNTGKTKKLTMGEYWSTTMALFWKNMTRLRRNIPVLLFQFALPAIQVILFCICIGGDPFNIQLAVVNEDRGQVYSQDFLAELDPITVEQHNFTSVEEGRNAVRNGSMWGVLHIPERFSQALLARMLRGPDVDNKTIEDSTIKIYPDLTNQQVSYTMERTFREAFQQFAKKALSKAGRNPALAEFPLALGEPVYGDLNHQGYLEYMAPGVVVSISYIMATGLTALSFILERRDGLFERSLVAGVDTLQILIAHALTQIIVMVVQILLVLVFTFLVFDIPSRGPFIWVIVLLLLQGCTGMAFGLVVSAVCHQENTAVMMILGKFYPNLILSGIVWPVEAMPYWIRWFSVIQPQTLPTETLRHILSRGWGITEPGVYLGFAVTITWMAVFLVAAAVIFKYNK